MSGLMYEDLLKLAQAVEAAWPMDCPGPVDAVVCPWCHERLESVTAWVIDRHVNAHMAKAFEALI